MVEEEVQREVEMENGGCFATSEASKDQVNLDADGHTKQTQKNMQSKTKRQKKKARERERERERERKEVNAVAVASSLCVEKVYCLLSLCCSLELVSV